MRNVCDAVFCLDSAPSPNEALRETRRIDKKYQRNSRTNWCTCTCSFVPETKMPLTARMVQNFITSFGIQMQCVNHVRSCPLSGFLSNTTKVTFARQYCGKLLARAIRASLTINRGAGGCSISHQLDIARVVSSDSPVFRVVSGSSLIVKHGVQILTTLMCFSVKISRRLRI